MFRGSTKKKVCFYLTVFVSDVAVNAPCARGFIHYACATDYVKAKRGNLACEVCLEDMTSLEVVAKRLRDERRQHLQNRAAMLVLNGIGGRRGGAAGGAEGDAAEDAGDPAMVIDDPRWYRPGWGSRNPLVWVLWIITRPFALLYAVRAALHTHHTLPVQHTFSGPQLPHFLCSRLYVLRFSVRADFFFFFFFFFGLALPDDRAVGLNVLYLPPTLCDLFRSITYIFYELLQLYRCCTNGGVQCVPMLTILIFWMIVVYSLFGSFSAAG